MSKKTRLILICIILIIPVNVEATRGCCSHHGGVSGCSSSGRQVCNDGSLSPSCTCTPTVSYTYGCTDSSAKNYNSLAEKDDGSCIYYVYGCTDSSAKNYNSLAEKDDGSCIYYVYGCTDSSAKNYNSLAEKDDGSCIYYVYGCTDSSAKNYNSLAEKDDGTCVYYVLGCTDKKANNYNPSAEKDDGSCILSDSNEFKNETNSSQSNINILNTIIVIVTIIVGVCILNMHRNKK